MILTQKLCFLIYAIFEIRKRYKNDVMSIFILQTYSKSLSTFQKIYFCSL